MNVKRITGTAGKFVTTLLVALCVTVELASRCSLTESHVGVRHMRNDSQRKPLLFYNHKLTEFNCTMIVVE